MGVAVFRAPMPDGISTVAGCIKVRMDTFLPIITSNFPIPSLVGINWVYGAWSHGLLGRFDKKNVGIKAAIH